MRQLVLLESGHRQSHSPSGAGVVSIGLHAAVIALAVLVTAHQPRQDHDPDSATRIYFARPQPAPADQPPAAQTSRSQKQPLPPPGIPRLSDVQSRVSAEIPDVLPPPSTSLFDPSVMRELGELPRGLTASRGGALSSAGGQYTRDEVEEPAAFLANQQPDYPDLLLRDGITGRVRVRFVVGVTGRIQGRPEVLVATHPAFAASVHSFLARARYRPARIGGTPVAQLVEQEFVFNVTR
jgi:protein TonB